MPEHPELHVIGVTGLGEVRPGNDIGALISEAATNQGTPLRPGDVVVVAQKIVSKAEGRLLRAETREEIREAARTQARRILRETPEHLIVETPHGFVCANAGIDASNVPAGQISLLPRDPDASAARIRATLEGLAGSPVAVIVSDTFGRAWRRGQVNVSIGSAGVAPLLSYRGRHDVYGRELAVTEIAQADELAAACELVMGKAEGVPAAIVRGYPWEPSSEGSATIVRPPREDLFR